MHQALVGVCIFDSKQIPGDGWACRPGEEPVRVSGVHDLANDLCWVTNLDFKTFQANGLMNLKHICQSQYFRQALDYFITDYGFSVRENKKAADFLASHFNRTAGVGYDLLGINPVLSSNNYRYSQIIANHLSLPIWKQSARGMNEELSQFIVDHSTQENQAMYGAMSSKSIPLHCHFPRFAYFKWLLSQPVPISMDWKSVPLLRSGETFKAGLIDGVIKNSRRVIDHFRNGQEKDGRLPFFRITVHKQNSNFVKFSCFGSGKKEARSWVCLPELLSMIRHSYVEIHEAYSLPMGFLADELDFLEPFLKIPDYSISHGLFLENVASAIMGQVNRKNTALGAYLRAYDRAACSSVAERLHLTGFLVGSYSLGRIVVLGQEKDRHALVQAAKSIGLIPFYNRQPEALD